MAATVTAFFGLAPVFSFIVNNPLTFAMWAVIYLVVGIVWSIYNRWVFVKKVRNYYNEQKASLSNNPTEKDIKFARDRVVNYFDLLSLPPKAMDHKSHIISSMVYWPMSMIWYLLADFLKEIFTKIFNYFRNLYQSISDSVFKDM